jgi:hypothetical protein
MIESHQIVTSVSPVLATEEQLRSYVTITVKLASELESVTRQLKNANGRLHSITEELNRLRASLKIK